jgi:putative phosphoribosyl transferase
MYHKWISPLYKINNLLIYKEIHMSLTFVFLWLKISSMNYLDKYLNRKQAGELLAKELKDYKDRDDVIVLALPRGGVPVGFEIAKALHVPLDVFIVRKLGVPGHSELAMGAIAMGDTKVFNEDIIRDLRLNNEEINAVIVEEQQELKRRESVYRGKNEKSLKL